MQYQLTINIDPQGLQYINGSGQQIAIAKVVNAPGNDPVAWLTFQPTESNQITWTDQYFVFASDSSLQTGSVIQPSTTTPAQVGSTYQFQNGDFMQGQPCSPNVIAILSQQSGVVVGIAQEAFVNGMPVEPTPIAAAQTMQNETVPFEPLDTVSLFLSPVSGNGVVVGPFVDNALRIALSSANPTAVVSFENGQFVVSQ